MAPSIGRIFSLAEANKLVPVVSELTANAMGILDAIRQQSEYDPLNKGEADVPESVLNEVERVLTEWSEEIQQLGAHPKGYFTVDFQSLEPEMLYCWTYGEDSIKYTHKVWENFRHRRPLMESSEGPKDHLKWIN